MLIAMPELDRTLGQLCEQRHSDSLRASLARFGVRAGDRVVLVMDNTPAHVSLLLLLVESQITPLLIAPESTTAERVYQLESIGGRQILEVSPSHVLSASASGAGSTPEEAAGELHPPDGECGIFLLTSGSTGRPSRVFRSLKSWRDEASRYCILLNLAPQHVLLIAAPLSHAYSLGWLWAAVQSGCSVRVLRPTELGGIAATLRDRATHCALTPALASLLARRSAPADRPAQLQVVMAGAGPVDAELEARFTSAFGLGLSRNYGSTESGALCAGLAPLPPLVLGELMPNLRLVEAPAAGDSEAFPLCVELEDGRVYRTGDLVVKSAAGLVIVGREGSAIRRGERWISPFEIESVLKMHPDVEDCSVRGVPSSRVGNDHIFASVLLRAGKAFDAHVLLDFSRQFLSRSKVPDRIEQVQQIRRNPQGKISSPKIYSRGPVASLLEAASAYKRSHLLFALLESGALNSIDGRKTSDQVAYEHGLHADTLARAMELASGLGLVVESEPTDDAAAPLTGRTDGRGSAESGAKNVIELERLLNVTFNRQARFLDVLRDGSIAAQHLAEPRRDEVASVYQQAMNGAHKLLSIGLMVREISRRSVVRPFKTLDVSATGGGYTHWLDQKGQLATGSSALLQAGLLKSGTGSASAELSLSDLHSCARRFDLVVIDNAIHYREIARQLPLILDCIAEGGFLVVDEIFDEPGAGNVGLDWLTHGGLCLPTESDVLRELSIFGFEPVARHRIPCNVAHHAILLRGKDCYEQYR